MKPAYTILARRGATVIRGASRNKRESIRECKRLARHLGVGATGSVRREGLGLLFQCRIRPVGTKAVLLSEEL